MADLYLTDNGDLAISPAGDLALTQNSWRDDAQQAYIRVLTDAGDYLIHPKLGASLSNLYGMPQKSTTGDYGVALIQSALTREGRFLGKNITVKAVPTGTQCQPTGTMVRIPVPRNRIDRGQRGGTSPSSWKEMPIELLKPGDRVVTMRSRWGLIKHGREITSITKIDYDGPIVNVQVNGCSSGYALNHPCIVVLGNALDEGNFVVYLMKRGDKYRIGRTNWRNNHVNGSTHGFLSRIKNQRADAAWILSVHQTEEESALSEVLTQVTFGIPSVLFHSGGRKTSFDLDTFWDKLGDNRERAKECLEHFGLLIDHPLWDRLTVKRTGNGWSTKVVTMAANLRSGMLAFLAEYGERPRDGWREKSSGIPWACWRPMEVRREWYTGDIYSLEVDKEHNYIADGILTHNSIRFDVQIQTPNTSPTQISVVQNLTGQ